MTQVNKKQVRKNAKELVAQNKKYCRELMRTINGLDFKSIRYIKQDLWLAYIEADYQYMVTRDGPPSDWPERTIIKFNDKKYDKNKKSN